MTCPSYYMKKKLFYLKYNFFLYHFKYTLKSNKLNQDIRGFLANTSENGEEWDMNGM